MSALRATALGLLCCSALGCGRTDLVRYSVEGEDLVDTRMRGPDGGLLCTDGKIALQDAFPVVMLVVDRSNSMNQSFPGTGLSKWNALRGALRQQLPAWNESLQLGLQLYPSSASASCSVSMAPDLAPRLGSVPDIMSYLDSRTPIGSTPTALAIERAAAATRGVRTISSARALVLATDGAPTCSTGLDPRTCTCINNNGTTVGNCTGSRCLDDARTLERLRTALTSGIPTWVIGLRSTSDDSFVEVMNRMADAGGKPRAGTNRFYSASSQEELELAFSDIRKQVGTCRYLTTSVPDLGGSIELAIDGEFTPYDETGTNGWQWADAGNGEIAVFGDACLKAQQLPASALTVVVRCAQGP